MGLAKRIKGIFFFLINSSFSHFILFYFLFSWLSHMTMWNLNYPTKGNLNPCPLEAWSLNPWAPREVPASCNFKYSLDSRGILSALGLLLSTRFLCLGLGYACRRNTIKVSSLNIFPFSPNTEVQQKYGYFRWSVFSFQIRAKIGLA